ncbi:carboxylesterase family protein [Leucobacter massiliensis]|uniref:carboxylesterase family protein n=1 Tax=Leucobacter massiliensis TaxID=1686285 RepID=UPI001FE2A0D8|nr:carboxylesterase family protein [Leucobacter massiliensis]
MAGDETDPLFAPPSGPVRGRVDGAVVRAQGIPFARAERFGAPSRLDPGTELREAVTPAPACPQHPVSILERRLGYRTADIPVDEACLRLSVTMPRGPHPEPLPVMVWLHGGAYVSGAGDLPFMDPAAFVAEQRLIVVTVTYRLGLLGFIGDGTRRTANAGLLDQLMAIDWVHDNIAAFGGDPGNVTLFGESAGADAILHLLATDGIAAKVRRAIVQSAPIGVLTRRRGRMHDAMTAAAEALDESATVDDALALQAEVERAARGFGPASLMPFGPQTGHHPVPERQALRRAWRDAAPRVELLIGHNAHEARFFADAVPALSTLGRVPFVGGRLQQAVAWLLTGLVYRWPALRWARGYRRAGGRVHFYRLSWSAPGNALGAAHTIDLALLFGDRRAWADAEIVRGAAWDDLDGRGRRVREVWGQFASGAGLPQRTTIPGALAVRSL